LDLPESFLDFGLASGLDVEPDAAFWASSVLAQDAGTARHRVSAKLRLRHRAWIRREDRMKMFMGVG
jgi:hypothetical protein